MYMRDCLISKVRVWFSVFFLKTKSSKCITLYCQTVSQNTLNTGKEEFISGIQFLITDFSAGP